MRIFNRQIQTLKNLRAELTLKIREATKSKIDDAMSGGIRCGEVIETTNVLNNAIRNQENELNQENTNEQGDRD